MSGTRSAETFHHRLEETETALYNFILKSLNFSQDADDVYQNTVMRAFRFFGGLKRLRAFRPWIFTIAHNEIRQYFRHRQPETASLPQLPAQMDDSRVRDVFQAAAQLRPAHREVFFLFYDHGYTIREISQITGLKEGNIKFILNRCREAIKKQLEVSGEQQNR